MASTAEIKTGEKTFKLEWKIPNWDAVQKNVGELLKQKFNFETLLFSETIASWEVGFLKNEKANSKSSVIFYHKLMELSGDFTELDTDISISYVFNNGSRGNTTNIVKHCFQEKGINTFENCACIPGCYGSFLDNTGSLKLSICLTVRFFLESKKTKPNSLLLAEFNNVSSGRLCKNWATIFQNTINSDLKIITSDNQEILAHKLVLQAQCPVFATTYHSEFSENTNATVNTTEISAKTMNVLLHYFYSGELSKTWWEKDVIVEFTAAVAKYKMNEIADMLDNVLGNAEEQTSWQNDWKLLKLARKMSLKKAEQRLNGRILDATKRVQNADELIALFRTINMADDESEEHGMLVRVNNS